MKCEPSSNLFNSLIVELLNELRDNESRNDTNIYLVGSENGETKIKLLNRENNEDVFERGLNVFFNYQTLWDEN